MMHLFVTENGKTRRASKSRRLTLLLEHELGSPYWSCNRLMMMGEEDTQNQIIFIGKETILFFGKVFTFCYTWQHE